MVEITNNAICEGINFKVQDKDAAKIVHFNVSLPLDHSRIGAKMDYTCGCAGYNTTAVQVLHRSVIYCVRACVRVCV